METTIETPNNSRKLIFYLAVISAFAVFIYLILQQGTGFEEGRDIVSAESQTSYWGDSVTSLNHSFEHPLAILLGHIATIIIVARFFGFLARKVGQPAVVGEVIAGIVLGPS